MVGHSKFIHWQRVGSMLRTCLVVVLAATGLADDAGWCAIDPARAVSRGLGALSLALSLVARA